MVFPASHTVSQPRPRKVVGIHTSNDHVPKRTPCGSPNPNSISTSSSPHLAPTAQLSSTAAATMGHPIKIKAKITTAEAGGPTRRKLAQSISSSSAKMRPSATTPSHHPTPSASVLTARITRPGSTHLITPPVHHSSSINHTVVQHTSTSHAPKAPPRPPSRSKSPFPTSRSPQTARASHFTQPPLPQRSRAHTNSGDRYTNTPTSDSLSSVSSSSVQPDSTSKPHPSARSHNLLPPVPATPHLHLSTRSAHNSNPPLLPTHTWTTTNYNLGQFTKDDPENVHHQLLSSLMTDAKAPELCVTSLASPVNLVDRRELVGLDSSSGFGNCISPLNSRPISIDSSDSSPPSGGSNSLWMQPLMPSDGELCSSRSSVGDAEKIPDEDWVAIARDDEIVGRHQNVVAVEPTAEPREDEARVNRKILDLEISNSSLLAINAALERTKLKQATEIRDLRKKLRERSIGPISGVSALAHQTEDALSVLSGHDDSEGEAGQENVPIECLMKEDQQFMDAMRLLESLIGRARAALVYEPGEKDLKSTKVLNRVEMEDQLMAKHDRSPHHGRFSPSDLTPDVVLTSQTREPSPSRPSSRAHRHPLHSTRTATVTSMLIDPSSASRVTISRGGSKSASPSVRALTGLFDGTPSTS